MTTATEPEVREALIDAVRRFVAREVVPVASELEHADEYPADIVEQMKAMGLFGITIPEELRRPRARPPRLHRGDRGARVRLDVAVRHRQHAHDRGEHHPAGTAPTQQQRALAPAARDAARCRGCLSLSEPDAGSDTRNISCRAVRDGDEYVISGTKTWVTNGERSGLVALAARTDEGITCFVVEKEPGPSVRRHHGRRRTSAKLGYKGIETVEMVVRRPPRRRRLRARRRRRARARTRRTSSARSRWAGSTSRRAPSASRAPRSTPRSAYAQERRDVRQADRRAPGDPAEARGHGDEARSGSAPHAQRGRAKQAGRTVRRRGRDGEAVRERDRVRGRDREPCASTAASATRPSSRSSATSATRR